MKNDTMQKNGLNLEHNSSNISDEKPPLGSTSGKHPVVLNDGRTVIFISDKSREAEIRLKYESLKDKKYPSRSSRQNRL